MEESHRLKGVRKKLWLSIALIGSLQYGGLITSIVTQRKTFLVDDACGSYVFTLVNEKV